MNEFSVESSVDSKAVVLVDWGHVLQIYNADSFEGHSYNLNLHRILSFNIPLITNDTCNNI